MQNSNWQETSPETAGKVWPGGQVESVQLNRPEPDTQAASQSQNRQESSGPPQTFQPEGQTGAAPAGIPVARAAAETATQALQGGGQAVLPRVDVLETDKEFIYVFEVPGPDPEQINIEVSAREIALTGPESAAYRATRYHYLERPRGRYMRLLRTPPNVNTNDVTARYRNGELELHLPKRS